MKESPFKALAPEPSVRRGRRLMFGEARNLRRRLRVASKKYTPTFAQYVLFLGGLASLTVGAWMIYRPLGPIVGGAIAVWLGMLMSVESNEPRS